MIQENKDEGASNTDYKDHGLDEFAIETANEMADEALSRFAAIVDAPLTEEEKELEIEKLLEELKIRGNDIYQQKKCEDRN